MSTEAQGPDQAIGWVVALSCFFINFIMAGLARTAGVLYASLIERYGVSREAAMTPFSIRVCVRNMTGPLIGLLGLKYGIRAVTTTGGFVAALGSILCCFATNIQWITVFWGVIHGIGFGLCTVIHMVIINQYFDKYKASAFGQGYSGDCFGTFTFPAIIEFLLTTYDIKGTFLLLGGISLHVIPLGLLLKKPPWIEDNKKIGHFSRNITRQSIPNSDIQTEYTEKERCQHSIGYKNEAFSNLDENLKPFEGIVTHCQESQNAVFEIGDDPPVYQDVIKTDPQNYNFRQEILAKSGSTKSHISEIKREDMERHDSLPPVQEKIAKVETNNFSEFISISEEMQPPKDEPEKEINGQHFQHSESISMKETSTPSIMSQMAHEIVHKTRTASFASQVDLNGFLTNIQGGQNETENEEAYPSLVQQEQYILKNGQIRPAIGDKMFGRNAATEQELPVNVGKTFNGSKDLIFSTEIKDSKPHSVLKTLIRTNIKPMFILISVTRAAYGFLFDGVLTIIIDYAVDHGVPQNRGKFLIIGVSVTDLIGRLSFGYIIDRKLLRMKNYVGVVLLLMGTLVAVIPLNTSFNFMTVCMCLYGLVQGGTAIMFPILVSYYMEKNEESVAMGCLNFYCGLLMLTMAPMIGFFRDNIGSYNGVFHILGGMVALVGIIWQFEPVILKFQKERLERRSVNGSEVMKAAGKGQL